MRSRLGRALGARMFLTVSLLALALALRTPAAGAADLIIHVDLVYRTIDGQALELDVYAPGSGGPFPAVVLVHGGGWKSGDKSDWAIEAEKLASAGFIAVPVNYRLAPDSHAVAPASDVRHAVRWLRDNGARFGIDTTRIGALGGSAGGNLAQMVAVTGRTGRGRADASVSWSGSTQLRLCQGSYACDTRANYVGCTLGDCPDAWDAASPYFRVDGSGSPIYLANSTDELVALEEATSMADRLDSLGVPSKLRVLEGGRHGRSYEDDVWDESVAFLQRYLG